MQVRIIVGISLLVGVLGSSWALAQGTGSGGIASDPAAVAVQSAAQTKLFRSFIGPVDHAAAGTGLRNFDSGTIRLRGIPPNSTVIVAFLYWAMICPEGTDCPRVVPIEFEGRTIDSTIICIGAQPCWAGTSVLGAYRVNVTGLMPATTSAIVANKVINGDYRINAFPSGDRDGSDPWTSAKPPLIEGATLLVVYSNPSLPTSGRVYIHEGCDMFSGTLDATNVLSPAAPSPVSFVKFTRFGADGQVGTGTAASPTTSNETTFFGGPSASCPTDPLTQIAGNGSIFDQDSDWNGHDGGPMNQLWDTRTTTVTGLLGAGAANYCVRYVSLIDCMNAIGYVLTVN